jgi:sugar phosphate isomerase/epimerase
MTKCLLMAGGSAGGLTLNRASRLAALLLAAGIGTASLSAADYALFARTNLVAWCIVPFDAQKRGPEERAAMLERLGFRLFAYDYRAEHIPTFDAEMEALKRHNVRLLAWWFPGALNDEAKLILDVLRRHHVRAAQLWISGGGEPTKSAEEQRARVEAEAARVKPIAAEAAKLGGSVALYNHGAWFGEPENQLEIIAKLRAQGVTNVGIVYNLHHGHDHLDRFEASLQRMKPHLLALNLNGMVRDGDKTGRKILPLGQGDLDLKLLRLLRNSGWRGPIGILNHTDKDAEARLLDNLDGLDWLAKQLDGAPPGPKPVPRSWREPQ